jgi:hypothetical protein
MQTSAIAAKIRPGDKPKTQLFSLKTPYMKQGRVTQLMVETTNCDPQQDQRRGRRECDSQTPVTFLTSIDNFGYKNFPTRNWLISSEPFKALPSITSTGTVLVPVSAISSLS